MGEQFQDNVYISSSSTRRTARVVLEGWPAALAWKEVGKDARLTKRVGDMAFIHRMAGCCHSPSGPPPGAARLGLRTDLALFLPDLPPEHDSTNPADLQSLPSKPAHDRRPLRHRPSQDPLRQRVHAPERRLRGAGQARSAYQEGG